MTARPVRFPLAHSPFEVWITPDHVVAVEEMHPDDQGVPRTGIILDAASDYDVAVALPVVLEALWPSPRRTTLPEIAKLR